LTVNTTNSHLPTNQNQVKQRNENVQLHTLENSEKVIRNEVNLEQNTLNSFLLLKKTSLQNNLLVIKGDVEGNEARILIDSGATLNFISADWVQKYQIPTENAELIQIHLANGEVISNCKQATVQIKLEEYIETLQVRILKMDKFDLILGKPWLKQVNPIINWKNNEISIKQEHNRIVLKSQQKEIVEGNVATDRLDQPETGIVSELNDLMQENSFRNKECENQPTETLISEEISNKKITKIAQQEEMFGMIWSSNMEDNLISKKQVKKEVKRNADVWIALVTTETCFSTSDSQLLEPWEQVEIEDNEYQMQYKDLCRKYKDIFKTELPDGLPPAREVDHEIKLVNGAVPPKKKLYRLSWQEEEVLKDRIQELLNQGFIRPSQSPYGAPVIFTKKKNGTLRMCVDYRALNSVTIKNSYPLPRIDQMFDKLQKSQVFSSLDCTSGYHQIRVKTKDIEKTAFNTRYGQYEYLVVPFGLCNAPATFQGMVQQIFMTAIDDYLEIFIDDLLVHSSSHEKHLDHLTQTFELCRKHQLYLKPSKCKIGQHSIAWVGHTLQAGKQAVDENKIKAIQEWKIPTNITQVRGFLGLCSYYRKFVKDFAKFAVPLQNLLKKNHTFKWTTECTEAFETLKRVMTKTPVLTIPSPEKEFEVITDASSKAIGAVLQQERRPIAYFSKTLTAAEQKYATHEQETLAIVEALKQWRVYLQGRHFIVWTDHYSLKYLKTQPQLSNRQARWLEFLEELDFELKYIKGKQNVVADALSRKEHSVNQISTITLKDDFYIEVKDNYEKDKYIQRILEDLQLTTTSHVKTKFCLEDGLLYLRGNNEDLRLCIPRVPQLLSKVIYELHDTPLAGHLGINKVYDKAIQNFYWPRMFRSIYRYIRSCPSCQKSKPSQQAKAGLLQPLDVPQGPWQWITMDFAVKLPKTPQGNEQVMVIVDRFTKKVHFIPLSGNATAKDVADKFFKRIVCQYGIPEVITSDRDSKFTSKFWKHLQEKLGSKLAMSTAYHPQTDGETERVIKDLKIRLRIFSNYQQTNWEENLECLEFVHNSTKHKATGHSPNYLNCGRETQIPSILLIQKKQMTCQPSVDKFIQDRKLALQDAKDSMSYAQEIMAQYANQSRRDIEYNIGDKVLLDSENFKLANQIQRPNLSLLEKNLGPYTIEAKIDKLNYQLKLPKTMKIHPIFHVTLLKKYHDPNEHFKNRKPLPPEPQVLENEEYYEVEKILDKRMFRRQQQYLIKWKGYDDDENSWVNKKLLIEDGFEPEINEFEKDYQK